MKLSRIVLIGLLSMALITVVACGGEGPYVSFSNWSVSPNPVVVGNPVTISVDATNNNSTTETFTFKLSVDGVSDIDTSVVTLAPGATQKVSFNYTPTVAVGVDHPGNYQIGIQQYPDGGAVGLNFNVIEATEAPWETGELPANYKFFVEWSDSIGGIVEMQYWAKGDKWRMDWSSNEGDIESERLLIYDEQFAYVYMPAMAQVIKYSSPSQMSNPGMPYTQEFEIYYFVNVSEATILAGFEAVCSGGTFTYGQEDVNVQSCTKFTCNSDGDVSSKWISDNGWLVRVERTTQSGYAYTMQYSNIELNADIEDSIFDIALLVPEGTELIDAQ